MQSGPGVFKGDLYFYMIDGDIRGKVGEIDIKRCPLFFLTGEYDYSCTAEGTLAVAERIGAQATIMKGLGHFPMSEDPEKFNCICCRCWRRSGRLIRARRRPAELGMTDSALAASRSRPSGLERIGIEGEHFDAAGDLDRSPRCGRRRPRSRALWRRPATRR